MWFPEELWREICGFLIHNITKHGKHLKTNDLYVKNYNEVVKSVPTIVKPNNGPYVIYNSATKSIRVAKFLYHNVQIN